MAHPPNTMARTCVSSNKPEAASSVSVGRGLPRPRPGLAGTPAHGARAVPPTALRAQKSRRRRSRARFVTGAKVAGVSVEAITPAYEAVDLARLPTSERAARQRAERRPDAAS